MSAVPTLSIVYRPQFPNPAATHCSYDDSGQVQLYVVSQYGSAEEASRAYDSLRSNEPRQKSMSF